MSETKQALKPIGALTSIRFFLIAYIVNGHFIQLAVQDRFWLHFWKQHNMVVGCFYLLSGYILAFSYDRTQAKGKPFSLPTVPFVLDRLCRIYPAYFVSLVLGAPMFIFIESHYGKSLFQQIAEAVSVFTLTQAWIPDLAQAWNSPTWFLSALLFCYLLFPAVFRKVRKLSKTWLLVALALTFMVTLNIKVVYTWYNGMFTFEGLDPLPNTWLFDFFRFCPLINALDFILGMLTAQMFATFQSKQAPRRGPGSLPSVLLLALGGLILWRAAGPSLNDMVSRTLIMTPLFLAFIYTLSFDDSLLNRLLAHPLLVYLGQISFSLYIVHSVIGQFFYKKIMRQALELPDISYNFYWVFILLASLALYHGVEVPLQRRLLQRLRQGRSIPKKSLT